MRKEKKTMTTTRVKQLVKNPPTWQTIKMFILFVIKVVRKEPTSENEDVRD